MKSRYNIITAIFGLIFLAIPMRMGFLYLSQHSFYKTSASQNKIRGSIYDRNGHILAATLRTTSIYADPSMIKSDYDPILEQFFPEYPKQILKGRANKLRFMWLERHSGRIGEIQALRIPGIYAKPDEKRIYAYRQLFSTLIGFCDYNGEGKHGVENSLNEVLKSNDVTLSLDMGLQSILYDQLSQAYVDFEGEGASGMIVDVRSGRILAMVSVPSPQENIDFLANDMRNRNLDPVEVGSVLKLINTTIAIESGKYTPDSEVDARGPLKVDKFEINDFFGVNRIISLKESLWRSSNIAHARVAWDIGRTMQQKFFKELGMLDKVEWLSGSYATPIAPKRWTSPTVATLAYGYGIAITTLHLARAILAIVTGKRMELSCLQDMSDVKTSPVRVFSKETVNTMKDLMYYVTSNGYRQTLWLENCKVGAKTGTANMSVNGKYIEGQNFVTLATVFPLDSPELICIIQMTNPKKHKLKRGRFTVAGNVLSQYMKQIMRSCLKFI